jgi:hypothetical protein
MVISPMFCRLFHRRHIRKMPPPMVDLHRLGIVTNAFTWVWLTLKN